ncbi:hypothetical protein C7E14_23100, partial [Stenotrophomonas maltophilia]
AALAASLLLAVQVTGDLKLALWVLGGLATLALAYVAALAASLLLAVQVTGDLKLALWVLGGLATLALA